MKTHVLPPILKFWLYLRGSQLFNQKNFVALSFLVMFPVIEAAAEYPTDNPAEYPEYQQTLNFAQAAERAVAASAELRNAYAEYAIQQQAWSLGVFKFMPRLGFSISENDRLQELGPDSFIKNYSISLDQLLWDGGKTSMARTLGRMELNAAFCRLERMAAQIAEGALAAYRSVLSSRTVLAVREAALDTLSGQRNILEREVELGLALPVDLAEADLTLAGVQIEIMSLQSDLDELERQFTEILGMEILPGLSENVNIRQGAVLPDHNTVLTMALDRNPELNEARLSIIRRQAEYKFAGRAWIPGFRLQGSFGLNGRAYPLTRYTWSVGINIELAGPWLQNNFTFQTGMEPPYDRTAQLQNSTVPMPNPESSLSVRQAAQVLSLEQEKYRLAMERLERVARRSTEKCAMADKMRALAVESIALAAQRLRLEELRLMLGQITRLDLMGAMIEYTQKEIAAINAAVNLLEAERELERLMDLKPGELKSLGMAVQTSADIL